MRFEEAYGSWQGGRLTQMEAASLLGVSTARPNWRSTIPHALHGRRNASPQLRRQIRFGFPIDRHPGSARAAGGPLDFLSLGRPPGNIKKRHESVALSRLAVFAAFAANGMGKGLKAALAGPVFQCQR